MVWELAAPSNLVYNWTASDIGLAQPHRVGHGKVVDFVWWSEQVVGLSGQDGQVSLHGIADLVNLSDATSAQQWSRCCRLDEFGWSAQLKRLRVEGEGLVVLGCTRTRMRLRPIQLTDEPTRSRGLVASLSSWVSWALDRNRMADPQAIRCLYELHIVCKRTPTEIVFGHMKKGDHQMALELCEVHGLDKDIVRKSQWETSDWDQHAISNYLDLVLDKQWVLTECLESIPETAAAQEALLRYGLGCTWMPWMDSAVEGEQFELTPLDHDMCLIRLELLSYLTRLSAHLKAKSSQYSPAEYHRFREEPLLTTALRYAQDCETESLNSIWESLSSELLQHRVQILEAIPETVPPSRYELILPAPTQPPGPVELSPTMNTGGDPVESAAVLDILGQAAQKFRRPEPVSSMADSELVDWYLDRGFEMDHRSGMIHNCIELLTIGIKKGVVGLEGTLQLMLDVHTIVQESTDPERRLLTLNQYQALGAIERLELLLESSTVMTIVENLSHGRAAQLLSSQPSSHHDGAELLRCWMVAQAKSDLSLCAAIAQQSAPTQTNGNVSAGLISNVKDLIQIVLECCYASERTDQIDLMNAMYDSLPNRAATAHNDELDQLQDQVDQLDLRLTGFQILGRLGAARPLGWLATADMEEQAELLTGLPRIRARDLKQSKVVGSGAVKQWKSLMTDMIEIQQTVAVHVDQARLQLELLRAMLSLGHLTEAAEVLASLEVPLAAASVATAVLDTAREIFNSAPSVESPGIEQAKTCLALVPQELAIGSTQDPMSSEIRSELQLVAAAQKLAEHGFNMLVPLQIRLRKNHVTTLREIVKFGITDPEQVLELSQLLGGVDEAMVRELLAVDAIRTADLDRAYEQCRWMMRHRASRRGWSLCHGLAVHPDLAPQIPIGIRIQLISFALSCSNCPASETIVLLADWRTLTMMDQTPACTTWGSEGSGLGLSLIHISEPTRLLSISYAVFCLKKKKNKPQHNTASII
eukprot:TRINITY_DN18220_c0_g2_i1.p1 TRINITY_DN18220_c0_g2~~TRINITY_DN18220_c0_g2_i1.p1  ORF type:complete len:987 (-),score=154.90 TRINITY_DN18220_c0_g2_i1:39-2999(-)